VQVSIKVLISLVEHVARGMEQQQHAGADRNPGAESSAAPAGGT